MTTITREDIARVMTLASDGTKKDKAAQIRLGAELMLLMSKATQNELEFAPDAMDAFNTDTNTKQLVVLSICTTLLQTLSK